MKLSFTTSYWLKYLCVLLTVFSLSITITIHFTPLYYWQEFRRRDNNRCGSRLYPSRRCPIYSPEPYCPFSSSLTSLCTSLSLTNRRRGPTDNRRIKSKTTPLPLGVCVCGYAPIRRPDARGSENRASADGYKIPQGKIDCGTRLNSAESLPVRADNAERGRGVKPQKSAISYNYNLACKLLPFAAPGDSRLHSLGTIPPNTKKPSRRFP